MKTSLLIGNGLNRCLNDTISWGDLLAHVAVQHDVQQYKWVQNSYDNVSFPMQFEAIINQIQKKNQKIDADIYSKIKKEIAYQIRKARLDNNAIHFDYVKLPVNTIMTTNYDYLLEIALDENYDVIKDYSGKKNTFFKYSVLSYPYVSGGKELFHIHGSLQWPSKVCLGYEHYAGQLQLLREQISTNDNIINLLTKKSYLQNDYNDSGRFNLSKWPALFFTDNIYIVGLSMSECEIDLWWLLTYRAYLFYNNVRGRSLIRNKIIYYDVAKTENKAMKYRLNNLNVDYVFIQVFADDKISWESAYIITINNIKQAMNQI